MQVQEIRNKRVTVAGLGRFGGGIAVARWLVENNASAFADMTARRIDALSVGIDGLTQANAALIALLAAERRLPAIYPAREFVELGGLFSYGPHYPDLYFRAAALIDKIFKGAKPAELPVEQPTRFEFIVNLKSAKALGLYVPPTLLARADEVLE